VAMTCIAVLLSASWWVGRLKSRPTLTSDQMADEITAEHLVQLTAIIKAFHKSTGTWPRDKYDFLTAVKDTNILLDAWGHEFRFVSLSNSPKAFWIESFGSRGERRDGGPEEPEFVQYLGDAR
jgi:type II secretory pathway pseudopilin PulG